MSSSLRRARPRVDRRFVAAVLSTLTAAGVMAVVPPRAGADEVAPSTPPELQFPGPMDAAASATAKLPIPSETAATTETVAPLDLKARTPAIGGVPTFTGTAPSTDVVKAAVRDVANKDGSRSVQLSAAPVRFQDRSGAWRDIDLTVVPTGDRALRARAAAASAVLGATAAGAVITAPTEAGDLIVSHPDAGDAAAVPAGTSVNYPGALPNGRTLRETLTVTGVKETVIAPTRDGGPGYTERFDLPAGLTARQAANAVEFVDAAGAVLAAVSLGTAHDSAPTATGVGAESEVRPRLVSVKDGIAIVAIEVDRNWWASPARVFPVEIDPALTWTSSTSSDIDCGRTDSYNTCDDYVNSDAYYNNYAQQTELRLGSPGGCEQYTSCTPNRTRTYIRFQTDNYYNYANSSAHIELVNGSASVRLYNWYYSANAAYESYDLYAIGSDVNNLTSWAPNGIVRGQPSLGSYISNAGIGAWTGWTTWAADSLVQSWINGSVWPYGVGLLAQNEYSLSAFRKGGVHPVV